MKRLTTLLSTLVGMMSTNVFAEYGLNMTKGVTSISRDIYDLHMLVFWICVIIAVLVFGAMFYSVFAHRQSKGWSLEAACFLPWELRFSRALVQDYLRQAEEIKARLATALAS